MNEWIFTLTHGRLVLQIPREFTQNDLEDSQRLLKLVIRHLPKFVIKPATKITEAVATQTPDNSVGEKR